MRERSGAQIDPVQRPTATILLLIIYYYTFIMAISYKVRKQVFKTNGTKQTMYFAAPVSNGETSIEQLQKLIAKISAVSEGDVRSVLLTLTQLLAIELASGRRVSLGDLGRMRIGLRSKAAQGAEEFKAQDIRRFRVIFTPGALIREELRGASVQRLSELGKPITPSEKPSGDTPAGISPGGSKPSEGEDDEAGI